MTATPPEPNQPYGAYPTDPAGTPRQAPPAPPQPPSIALAVKLMWAGAALSVLSLLYSLTTLGSLKDDVEAQLVKNDPNVEQSVIDAVYGVSIAFAIIFGLIGAVLWAWMAWKNGQGRSWARIVATSFAGLNLLGLLYTLAAGSTDTLSAVSSVVSALLGVIVLVFLWRKESSDFYQATAASRRMY